MAGTSLGERPASQCTNVVPQVLSGPVTGTRTASSSSTRSSKQKASQPPALQKPDCLPIISRLALLGLAEWWEAHGNLAQGGSPCAGNEVGLSPPALGDEGGDAPRETLDEASTGTAAAGAADSGV